MPNNKKILVVDDEIDLLDLFCFGFEDLGYEVFRASSVDEAFNLLKTQKIDYLLSDLNVNNDSGLDLVDNYNNLSNKNHLKGIFIMTGFDEVDYDKYLEKGVSKVFIKPMTHIDVDQFISTLA